MDASTVAKVLDELGKRLSEPASHVWNVMVRQSFATGIGDLVISFLGLLCIATVIKLFPTLLKSGDCDDPLLGLVVILFFAAVASTFIVPIYLIDGVKEVINPEYYALMDIVNHIGGNR